MARIAFCQDQMVEYMGTMVISAVLKQAGHEVALFIDDGVRPGRSVEALGRFRPDLVAFSLLTPTVPWALEVASLVKERLGALTICGNVHAILSPEIVHDPAVDIVCIGEGEGPMRELAGRIDRSAPHDDIPALWVKSSRGEVRRNPPADRPVDLDALPDHDRSLYDKYAFFRRSRYLRFLLGRGCPLRCSFCSNPRLADRLGRQGYVRKRSPARAIAELERLVAARRPSTIYFIDEVFWLGTADLREFLRLYRARVCLPFQANFRPGPVDEQDIALLAEAGARTFILAAESGDERQRMDLLNKPVRNEELLRVGRLLRKHGIRFSTNAFFGLPGDLVEDHLERLAFYRELRPDYLWTTFFQPYPGAELTERLEREGLVPLERTFGPTFHHAMSFDLPDRARIENLKKVYYLMMRFPAAVPLLERLIALDLPLLFDALFLAHFAYYALTFERVSLVQFLQHVRVLALNPAVRRLLAASSLLGRRPRRPPPRLGAAPLSGRARPVASRRDGSR